MRSCYILPNSLMWKIKKGLHSDGTFSLCLSPPDNAIPIKSWFSDAQDTALLELLPMLDALRFTNDVRSVLSRNLHLHSLWWCVWCNYGEFCFICRMFLYHTIVCIRCKMVNFLVFALQLLHPFAFRMTHTIWIQWIGNRLLQHCKAPIRMQWHTCDDVIAICLASL